MIVMNSNDLNESASSGSCVPDGSCGTVIDLLLLLLVPPPLSRRSRAALEGPVGGPQGRHNVSAPHLLQAGGYGPQ